MVTSVKKLKISSFVIAIISAGLFQGTALANNPNALTFSAKNIANAQNGGLDLERNATFVRCSNCDPYKGDTAETEKLRILCFVPANLYEPIKYADYFASNWQQGSAAVNNWRFYYAWSKGYIGLSKKYVGTDITSLAVGDQFCKDDLRDGDARMFEFHDNGVGGWNAGGEVHVNSRAKNQLRKNADPTVRYWITVNDQKSNLWD